LKEGRGSESAREEMRSRRREGTVMSGFQEREVFRKKRRVEKVEEKGKEDEV